eukprot:RCo008433
MGGGGHGDEHHGGGGHGGGGHGHGDGEHLEDYGPGGLLVGSRSDQCMEMTLALPKAQEMGALFSSYGGKPGTRPKVGTFILTRPGGGATVFGAKYYNIFNIMRLSVVGKYLAFVGAPYVFWNVIQAQQGFGHEYNLDLENYAPFEAKKNPAHGH